MNDVARDGLELLRRRLASPEKVLVPVTESAGGVIQAAPRRPEPFVVPQVADGRDPGDPDAPIVLVSASAAVGKSYLARYLAATTGNPLWDLSRSRTTVGTNYFHGTLVKEYGAVGFGKVAEALACANLTLIIDALDEALVAATLRGFLEAVSDLSILIGPQPAKTCKAVLFGRPESLDYVALELMDSGIPWQRMHLDFFAPDEAMEFMHIIAQSAAPDSYSREVVQTFAESVIKMVSDAVKETLPSGVSADHDLLSFLGYAPVLDALARIAVSPAREMVENVDGARSDFAVWEVLGGVLDKILSREQEKIVVGAPASIRDALTNAFHPSEQIRLLLSQDPGTVVRHLEDLDPGEAEDVRARIEQQMADHAFKGTANGVSVERLDSLANVAIRDFVAAKALLSADPVLHEEVIRYYSYSNTHRSPLLVRLLMSGARGGLPDAIPVRAAGLVLDSASLVLGDRDFEIVISESSGGEPSTSEALTMTAYENDLMLGEVSLRGDDAIRVNQFARSVAVLAPNASLELGDGSREIELGPACHLDVERIISHAPSIRLAPSGEVSMNCVELVGSTRRVSAEQAKLTLRTDRPAAPPWSDYRSGGKRDRGRYSEAMLRNYGLEMRRYVRWFLLRSTRGKYHYPRTPIDDLVKKGILNQRTHNFLTERGYISSQGVSYVLDLPVPPDPMLRVEIEHASVRAFLEDYATWIQVPG